MKAVKLIYFADRYHLRKYGRPIVGDRYLAMKFGPVGSDVLNIANLAENELSPDCLRYAKKYLTHTSGDVLAKNVVSRDDVDFDVFSQTDIEALETVYREFGDRDQFELAEMTHVYPEWTKHQKDLSQGRKSRLMNYDDFFSEPRSNGSTIFTVPEDHLKLTREIYHANKEVEQILS